MEMPTARLFASGHGQFVVLPKNIRMRGTELSIVRCGGEVVLREKVSMNGGGRLVAKRAVTRIPRLRERLR
jgi:hypothetical protein